MRLNPIVQSSHKSAVVLIPAPAISQSWDLFISDVSSGWGEEELDTSCFSLVKTKSRSIFIALIETLSLITKPASLVGWGQSLHSAPFGGNLPLLCLIHHGVRSPHHSAYWVGVSLMQKTSNSLCITFRPILRDYEGIKHFKGQLTTMRVSCLLLPSNGELHFLHIKLQIIKKHLPLGLSFWLYTGHLQMHFNVLFFFLTRYRAWALSYSVLQFSLAAWKTENG